MRKLTVLGERYRQLVSKNRIRLRVALVSAAHGNWHWHGTQRRNHVESSG